MCIAVGDATITNDSEGSGSGETGDDGLGVTGTGMGSTPGTGDDKAHAPNGPSLNGTGTGRVVGCESH